MRGCLFRGVITVPAVAILYSIPALKGFFGVPQLIVTGLLPIPLALYLTNKFGMKLMSALLGLSEKLTNKLGL